MAGLPEGVSAVDTTTSKGETAVPGSSGLAIFSTSLGTTKPQMAMPSLANIVISGDEAADCQALVAHLRKRFPESCDEIIDPDAAVAKYFDQRDTSIVSANVIRAAIRAMCHENGVRAAAVKEFAEGWRLRHPYRAQRWLTCGRVDVFNVEHVKEYGETFLREVLYYLQANYEPIEPINTFSQQIGE